MAVSFNIFRYQILPFSREQMSLFDQPISADELVARKNELFLQTLQEVEEFRHAHGEVAHKIIGIDKEMVFIRIGVNRKITRETRDFAEEEVDNWPNSLVIFNNRPDIQTVAVEIEHDAFRHTHTLISIIQEGISQQLDRFLLRAIFNPIFNRSDFWDIVNKYPQRITETTFRMVSPNMSNISETLELDLRAWNRMTNTQETTVQLRSDSESHLTLREGEQPISSLVDYSSQGGGNIKMKVKGLVKKISTEEQVVEISIEELNVSLESETATRELSAIFRDMLTL